MLIVKFENRTPRPLEKMVEYVFDPEKTDEDCSLGIGINPRFCQDEWWVPWKIYNISPEDIAHTYVQVIVSLELMPVFLKSLWIPIFYEIGQSLITDRRQVIGGIHFKGTEHVHCHYLINYLSFEGTLYRQEHKVSYYRAKIEQVVEQAFN